MERHDPLFTMSEHPSLETVDRWRCGLLPPKEARLVDEHLTHCSRCRSGSQFATRVVSALEAIPVVLPSVREPKRRLRWGRLAVAGAAMATLVLAVTLALPRPAVYTPDQTMESALSNPGTSDVIQHLDFYQWLAQHPELLKEAQDAGQA